MERARTVLADIESFGRIYNCGDCNNIHVQIGPVSLTLSVEAYMQLVALVNTSAANFEQSVAWSGADDHELHN